MTPADPRTDDAPAASWTIARICQGLNPFMERRFLLDLIHAPSHEVMNVFTAWQNVAMTTEERPFAGATPAVTALPTPTERNQ